MTRLALLVYIIVAPTIAGIMITVALSAPALGLDGLGTLWIVAIVGFIISIAPAIWIGSALNRTFNGNGDGKTV